jgi:hypothetical protein
MIIEIIIHAYQFYVIYCSYNYTKLCPISCPILVNIQYRKLN